MTTSSFWYEDAGLEVRPALTADAECDLLVVGSQFQPDGSVINGPAIRPLAEAD